MLDSASPLSSALSILAPTLTLARSVPQSIRIIRSGAEGVSQVSWLLVVGVAELWVVYGFLYHVPAEVVTNVPNCLMAVLILVLAALHHRTMRNSASSILLCTIVASGIAVVSIATNEHSIISFLAVSGAVCLYLPQLRHVMRSASISGLSLLSWLLALGASICWGVYGLTIHQPAVSLPSVVLIPSAALIVLRILTHVQPVDS
ncbi:MAG: PQ-loop domain-containing transporter [Acidimicrobiales bacterium]